jgi:hypothetical protein
MDLNKLKLKFQDTLFHLHRYEEWLPTCLWRQNRQGVPKRWHLNYRDGWITHKKAYDDFHCIIVWQLCDGISHYRKQLRVGISICLWDRDQFNSVRKSPAESVNDGIRERSHSHCAKTYWFCTKTMVRYPKLLGILLIFCWPCIIMYHNNVTNLTHFHFH